MDGAGNEITVPAYAVDGAVAAGAENRPPPATAAERASRRAAAQEARSHELWKKINPGFMRQPAGRSEYDVALAFDEAKLDAAKNCSAANWRHHLRKTDTAEGGEELLVRRVGEIREIDGWAGPGPGPGGSAGSPAGSAARERYRGAVKRPIAHRGGARTAALARGLSRAHRTPAPRHSLRATKSPVYV